MRSAIVIPKILANWALETIWPVDLSDELAVDLAVDWPVDLSDELAVDWFDSSL